MTSEEELGILNVIFYFRGMTMGSEAEAAYRLVGESRPRHGGKDM